MAWGSLCVYLKAQNNLGNSVKKPTREMQQKLNDTEQQLLKSTENQNQKPSTPIKPTALGKVPDSALHPCPAAGREVSRPGPLAEEA